MKSATTARADDLVRATVPVIKRLLANVPTKLPQSGWRGDQSDTITGYKGIKVYLFTADPTLRGRPPVAYFAVEGPHHFTEWFHETHRGKYQLATLSTGYVSYRVPTR